MNETFHLDTETHLEFRPTPWDTRAFGFNTLEVLAIQYKDPEKLLPLLSVLDHLLVERQIKFVYTRIKASDLALKQVLQDKGFYYAETSLLVTKRDLQKEDFQAILPSTFPLTRPSREEDFHQCKGIARDAFRYSRFHEDPRIGLALAQRRNASWVDDLRAQGKEFLILAPGQQVRSFLAFHREEQRTTLILAGSAEGFGYLTPYFWSSFLQRFQEQGVKRADALISAANMAIWNVYAKFRFRVEEVLLGFHRIQP